MKTIITIRINYAKPSLFRVIFILGVQFGGILVGVLTNSAAMEWSGFVVGILALIGMAAAEVSKSSGLTFTEARARIDDLERSEK